MSVNPLDAASIISQFLYGATNPPSDFTAESLIRADGVHTTLEIDINEYMATIGRFAVPANFPMIDFFFGTPDLPPKYVNGVLSPYTKQELSDHYGLGDSWWIKIQHYGLADGTDDLAERTLLWNTTAFAMGAEAEFWVLPDGTREIRNLSVEPYLNVGAHENFDFESIDGPTGLVNPVLKTWMDPSGIGRTVDFIFTDTVSTFTYTESNYLADKDTIASWTSVPHDVVQKVRDLAHELFDDGITATLGQDGEPVVYGTNNDNQIGTSKLVDAAVPGVYPPFLYELRDRGTSVVAGGGNDTVLLDEFRSGGVYTLHGGDGEDTLNLSDLSNTQDELTISVIDGDVQGPSITVEFEDFEHYIGGSGEDYFYLKGDELSVDGGGGRDTVDFSLATQAISGPISMPNIEIIRGSGFNDVIMGGGSSKIELFGGLGSDTLVGGQGADKLYGNDDNDADTLTGGGGADVFYVGDGDIVTDATTSDRLALSDGKFISGEATRPEGSDEPYEGDNGYTFTLSGSNLTIDAGGARITIQNFSDGDLGITLREEDDDDDDSGVEDTPNPVGGGGQLGSPLVFDLDGDGLDLVHLVNSGAYFDINRDGLAEWTGWVGPDDGLLTLDRNGNGAVDGADELFGYHYYVPLGDLSGGIEANNGFYELSALDSNGDRQIDSGDADYGALRIWRDLNGDGVSEGYEQFSLAALGIESISLISRGTSQIIAGNPISDLGSFRWADGSAGIVADVWFRYDAETTRAPSHVDIPPEIDRLPNLSGGGRALDLHSTAVHDAVLAGMLKTFAAFDLGDVHSLISAGREIAFRWLGADTIGATDRGPYVDGRIVAALETYYGEDFGQNGLSNPRMQAGGLLTEAWQGLQTQFTLKLLAQTTLGAALFPGLTVQAGTVITVDEAVSLSTWIDNLAAHTPADPSDAQAYWLSAAQFLGYLQPTLGYDTADFIAAMDIAFDEAGLGIAYSSLFTPGSPYSTPMLMIGSDGADSLLGRQSSNVTLGGGFFDNNEVFFGGRGNDLLRGMTGSDTYLFTRNSGTDAIEETPRMLSYETADRLEQDENGDQNTIVFVDDVVADDLTFSRVGEEDLKISIANDDGGYSTVIVRRYFYDPPSILSEIRFADGSSLSYADILGPMLPTERNDMIFVLPDTAAVDGLGGNDRFVGNEGDQSFIFGRGSGLDVIGDRGGVDSITFKAGIDVDDLTLERQGDDLVIRILGSPDSLTIYKHFGDGAMETFLFSDGSSLDAAGIAALLNRGSPGDDHMSGSDGNDVLDGGAGNDVLEGRTGDDIYVFGLGSGKDRVLELEGEDTVRFGAGIQPEDLIVARGGRYSNDLMIQIAGTDDRLTIQYQFGDTSRHVERFEFDGGVVLTGAQFEALIPPAEGTAADDDLYGTNGDDRLDGGAGDDYLAGGLGDDIYVFGTGYGSDFVEDSGGTDTVAFAPGITLEDVVWEGDGFSLRIGLVGTSDGLVLSLPFMDEEGIETFTFADGTIMTQADVLALMFGGTPGDDVVHGIGWVDYVVDLGAGDDWFEGQNDNVFAFGLGSGHDTVLNVEHVIIKPGLSPADVSFHMEDEYAVMTLTATGETLRIEYSSSLLLEFIDGGELDGQQIAEIILASAGTAGDDEIHALSNGVNVLDGGAGNDLLVAGEGTGIVAFDAGGGIDRVLDFGGGDSIRFGPGIDAGDVDVTANITENGVDLVFTIGDDQLIIDRFVSQEWTGNPYLNPFAKVDFASGADWTWEDVALRFQAAPPSGGLLLAGVAGAALIGSAGADIMLGEVGDDVLTGGAGDDILDGGEGSDTYIFSSGHGDDRIFEYSYDAGVDEVRFAGVQLADVQVTGTSWGDVNITIAATGDVVRISDLSGIETFTFEDATFSGAELGGLVLASQATSGDDEITGFDWADNLFTASGGDDLYYAGGAGNDYAFEGAFGHDVIQANTSSDWNRLEFTDLLASDVTFRQTLDSEGGVRMVISHVSGDRSVTLENWGDTNSWGSGSDPAQFEIRFADGVTWTMDQVNDQSMLGGPTAGDDFIVGDQGDETFDPGAGDDVVHGGGGDDILLFDRGYGHDLFDGEVQVVFGADITLSDLRFRREGGAYEDEIYVISVIGSDDELRLTNIGYAESSLTFVIDGLVIGYTSLFDKFLEATSGDDHLQGTGDDEQLEGLGGDDILVGQWGEDEYIFGADFGRDTIVERGGGSGVDIIPVFEEDIVRFTDHTFEQLTFLRVGEDFEDLLITAPGGNQVLIDDFYLPVAEYEGFYGIDALVFANGVEMSRTAFANVAADLSGDGTFETGDEGGVIEGGAGTDTLQGGRGDDTYIVSLGDLDDVIIDAGGENDVIAFSAGVDPLNVSLAREDDDLLIMVEGAGGLTLRITGQFGVSGPVIEAVNFHDGRVWTSADIEAAVAGAPEEVPDEGVILGTAYDDWLLGSEGDDEIVGGGGVDWIDGGAGADTVVFAGASSAFTWTRQADGSILAANASTGESAFLTNMEAAAFEADEATLEIADLVADYGTPGDDDWIEGIGTADRLYGLVGDDTLAGRGGDDLIDGGSGEDVAVFSGSLIDYTVTRNMDGSISVIDATGVDGSDTLVRVEGLFFQGDDLWRSAESLVGQYGTPVNDAWLEGAANSDNIFGLGGDDTLVGRAGDDRLDGGEGFDQANYVGDFDDFIFTRRADGLITVSDTTGAEGADTLVNVEAVYFDGSQTWAAVENLVAGYGSEVDDPWIDGTAGDDNLYGLAGDDTLVGRGGDDFLYGGAGFDQANYFGSSADFSFVLNSDGTVTVTDLVGDEGTDILSGMEALYFEGDQAWGTIEDALGLGGSGQSAARVATGEYGQRTMIRIDDGEAPVIDLITGLSEPLSSFDPPRDYIFAA